MYIAASIVFEECHLQLHDKYSCTDEMLQSLAGWLEENQEHQIGKMLSLTVSVIDEDQTDAEIELVEKQAASDILATVYGPPISQSERIPLGTKVWSYPLGLDTEDAEITDFEFDPDTGESYVEITGENFGIGGEREMFPNWYVVPGQE